MNDDKKRTTEQEQAEAGRAMLAAALEALGEFPCDVDEEDQDETARRVILALVAAAKVERSEGKRLSDLYGDSQYVYTDPHEAVATAFWMWSEKIEIEISEVSAPSVAGARYLGFAQGLAAARAMTEALDMLDGGSGFAFSSRGAEHLAPKPDSAGGKPQSEAKSD